VWVALMVVALFGMGALVVDAGALYVERRQLQNGADAGALAVAADCARGDCLDEWATADTYADRNARDNAAAIDLVCGSGPGLAPCSPPPPGTTGASGYVRVVTSTDNPSNGGNRTQVRFLMAPVLNAANVGGTVRASAVAAWGAPGAATTIPLIFSICEFRELGGSTNPPVFPSGRNYIYFHGTVEAGTCPAGPSGADLAGGFGWLSSTNCLATIVAGQWVNDKPGNSIPNGCDPTLWRNAEVLIPMFDQTNGLNGNNGSYRVVGFAGFRVLGYRFPSAPWPNGFQCPGQPGNNGTCLYGEFTRVTTTADGFGGADFGVRVIRMIG
jgi:Flp pilus assembly protein TadG